MHDNSQRVGSTVRRIAIGALAILFLCCRYSFAQSLDIHQYIHKAWTVREGFFKGWITSIVQTSDGYLWLGSDSGLFRFDGVQAVEWQPPAGEQLPNGFIRSLLAARDGTLWIGTNKGLAAWKDGKLIHYSNLVDLDVVSLLEDREGTVWAGSAGTATSRLCAILGRNVECYGDDGVFGTGANVHEDSQGTLWVGAQTGLWRWKPGPRKLYPMREMPSRMIDDGNRLLIATSAGIKQFSNEQVEVYPVPSEKEFPARRVLRDRDAGLWIGTGDRGLLHVHQGKTEVFARSDGLSDNIILDLFEDREGNIWVATRGGLDRFRAPAVRTISVKQGLSSIRTTSVLASADGGVWIGAADGLNTWKDGRISVDFRAGGSAPYFQDSLSRIWAARVIGSHYLDYYENGRFTTVNAVRSGLAPWSIAGNPGNVWISRIDGLFHVHGSADARPIGWEQFGRQDSALALLPDSSGGLWLGFLQGGVAYFKDAQVMKSYSATDGLGKGRVEALQFDRDGTLWAATEGGISWIKNGRIVTLTRRNGLPCDSVHWMMEDDEQSVWVYLSCGLMRIARSELESWKLDAKRTVAGTIFDASDGVTSSALGTLFSPQVAKSKDGKLWFISGEGVSVIDPKHIQVNNVPPPVYIEQIVADRRIHWQNLSNLPASNLRLPALSRDLEIDYTALSLVAEEKVRFKYKLEGYDRDWQDAGNRRQAFYTSLSPRSYRFRVIASNNSGIWNETGASLDFSIAPAFYQATWFRLSIGVAVLALIVALYEMRVRFLSRQFNLRLEERVRERTRIARDLHDTLLQSFQGLLLRFHSITYLLPHRPDEARSTLESVIEQARNAITEGRDAVQGLRAPAVLNDLASAIGALGGELTADYPGGSPPDFRVLVEGAVRSIAPIPRDEAYRIAIEAVRNAFRHANASRIEVEIDYGQRQFRLRIRDNGKGIDPKVLRTHGVDGHYGLTGMHERANLIGGKFAVWSELDTGTEVELIIPASVAYAKSHIAAADSSGSGRLKNV